MCVVVWTLNCKREDPSELDSFVDSIFTCLSDCGIAICQGKACNQEQVELPAPNRWRGLRMI